MLKYVITGSGRCGTTFAARSFCSAGIKCSHEKVFRLRRIATPRKGVVADASWKFPMWPNPPIAKDAIIIHLVRHPLKVFGSWLRTNPMDTQQTRAQKMLHRREVQTTGLTGLCTMDSLAEMWIYRIVEWNALIERICATRESRFCRVEDGMVDLIASLPGETGVPTFADTRCNGWEHPDIKLADIPPGQWKDKMIKMGERYGYELC